MERCLLLTAGKHEMMETKRIMHVDRDPMARYALMMIIDELKMNEKRDEFAIAQSLSKGEEAIQIVERDEIDLVILDLELPDMNGYQLARQLRKVKPELKIMFLSMHAALDNVHRAIETGALGFVSKRDNRAQLIDAIRAVLSERLAFEPQAMMTILQENKKKYSSKLLSNLELKLLKLVYMDKSRKEISTSLKYSIRTIDLYIEQLIKKLGVKSKVGLALYAERHKLF